MDSVKTKCELEDRCVDPDEFKAEVKKEFMTKFDENIGVNIVNLEALTLYTEISNDDPVALSNVVRLLKTLD